MSDVLRRMRRGFPTFLSPDEAAAVVQHVDLLTQMVEGCDGKCAIDECVCDRPRTPAESRHAALEEAARVVLAVDLPWGGPQAAFQGLLGQAAHEIRALAKGDGTP